MREFRDRNDKRWSIDLTIGAVMRVKATSGGRFNLFEPTSQVDGQSLNEATFTDLAIGWELLWLLVEPQAQRDGTTAEQFGEAMAADNLLTAIEAFHAEWIDFFRKLRRPDTATALEMLRKAKAKALDAVTARLTPELTRTAESRMDAAILAALNESLGS